MWDPRLPVTGLALPFLVGEDVNDELERAQKKTVTA
jgi:hypothetical protein